MTKVVNLYLIVAVVALLCIGGISASFMSNVKEPISFIRNFLNDFEQSSTMIDNQYYSINDRLDQRDDQLCVEQLNLILNGLNSSELWALKCE